MNNAGANMNQRTESNIANYGNFVNKSKICNMGNISN